MTIPRSIPTSGAIQNPTHSILVNGNQIPGEYLVESIVVSRQVNKVPTAKIVLFDGDPSTETFEISSSSDFVPNTPIEIKAGYDRTEDTIFQGIITRQSIQVHRNKPSILTIECKHEAVKLTVGRKNAYFYDKTDQAIINEVAGGTGASLNVESTTGTHPEMVQFYSTDWDFVVSRAEANGMFVYCEDGAIKVEAPNFSNSPVVSVLHGATVLNIDAAVEARFQLPSVQASAWDAAQQSMKNVSAANPNVTTPGNLSSSELSGVVGLDNFEIRHGGQLKDDELQQWANAQWMKSQLSQVRGSVRFQGFPSVLPGNMIELGGLGDRFNGNAFVSCVKHEINAANWETDVSFGMDREWFSALYPDIVTRPAEGLLPAVNGLQLGIVTKLEEDPDGEDRVRVRIPMIDPAGEGVWARIACLDAGDQRGSFFRPEINDEVVLGFLEDDPRYPVILGQLNSSSKPAPVSALDTNHEKGFYTRDQLKLVFNDEKKSITLETPGGQSLVIDDDQGSIVITDSNGNTITLDSSGITMDSGGDVAITASTAVTAESGTELSLTAGTEFKATGSAGAEMTTSAIAKIEGSLVQIN